MKSSLTINNSRKDFEMKYLTVMFAILTAFFFISGCGSSNQSVNNTNLENIPDWYLKPPKDPNYFFSAQTETSRDLQMAVDKAVTAGRADIARQVQVKLGTTQDQFKEEVGADTTSELLSQFTQVNETVAEEAISGSHIDKQKIVKDGGLFRAYVLVEYPVGAANEAMLQQIKNKEHLYTRFRASQAYKNSEKKLKQYEEWKKSQEEKYQEQSPGQK